MWRQITSPNMKSVCCLVCQKYEEVWRRRERCVWTSCNTQTKPCSKPLLKTLSKPPANQLPKVLPKVLRKPVKHTNKKAFAPAKGYLSNQVTSTLHKCKHSLSVSTRFQRGRGGVQTLGKACPATPPDVGTYFLGARRHNTFYGNLTIRSTNAPQNFR